MLSRRMGRVYVDVVASDITKTAAVVHQRRRDGEAGEQYQSLGPMFISQGCRAARVESGALLYGNTQSFFACSAVMQAWATLVGESAKAASGLKDSSKQI